MAGETQPQRPSGMEESYVHRKVQTILSGVPLETSLVAGQMLQSNSVGLYPIIGIDERLFSVDSNSLSQTLLVYI